MSSARCNLKPDCFEKLTHVRTVKTAIAMWVLIVTIVAVIPGVFPLQTAHAQSAGDELLLDDGDDLLLDDGDDLLLDDSDDLLLDDGDDLLLDDGDDLLSDDSDGGDLLSDDGDDLLSDDSDGDDLLSGDDESTASAVDEPEDATAAAKPEIDAKAAELEHLAIFANSKYPSANTCRTCHPRQYDQWSVSQHAYAQLSPVYMAFQNAVNGLTNGTNGDFCIRCHNQVGMNLGESTYISNLDRPASSREGVTCVVCHRLELPYGKVSGRLPLVQGELTAPIYGPAGNAELERVLDNTDKYRVVTDPEKAGRKIHGEVIKFAQISTSGFCGTCHDVNLFNGFRLEEAFSEYKTSPSAANGETCQDCHMGKEQGVVSGYEQGPAATVGGVDTEPRKLTDHFFAGPDYPLIHPGIFPHNSDAAEMASLRDWLKYDHEAGWGTDEFEDNIPEGYEFPERWAYIDDRYDAREIMDRQFALRESATEQRLEVLKNGIGLGDIAVTRASSRKGLRFEVPVKNLTAAHNVPTGFDAERVIWLQVTVTDSTGQVVFKSGDLDPNGDVRDTHSLYVHNGEVPLDKQLFSLQSRFLTRSVRGGEREQVLAVNYSVDPLPFVRPFTRSLMLTGQPAGARKHRRTIPPLASRIAPYKIKGSQLSGPGEYHVNIKLRSGAIPVNLLDAIKGVGFDYNMSAHELAQAVVAGHITIWEKDVNVGVE
jgi:nitrate/TMAO reductase-like tetraheme cytochrome c subunit